MELEQEFKTLFDISDFDEHLEKRKSDRDKKGRVQMEL